MNNDKNKIMGIGLVKNVTIPTQRSRIYEDEIYNKYIYKGKNHITREKLMEMKTDMVLFLEKILFHGCHHFKRGNGCTILSKDRISQAEYYDRPIQRRVYRCKICGKKKKRPQMSWKKSKISSIRKEM